MADPYKMLKEVCEDIKSSPDKLEERLAKFMAIFKYMIENGLVDGEKIMKLSEKNFKKLEKV